LDLPRRTNPLNVFDEDQQSNSNLGEFQEGPPNLKFKKKSV
jgi:hypothetical protein